MVMSYEQWGIILGVINKKGGLTEDNIIEKTKNGLRRPEILESPEISRILEEISHELEISSKIPRVQETQESLKKRVKFQYVPKKLEELEKIIKKESGLSNPQEVVRRILKRLGVQETSEKSKAVELDDRLDPRKISEKVSPILDTKNILETLKGLRKASKDVYIVWEENGFHVNYWFRLIYDIRFGHDLHTLLSLANSLGLENVKNALLKVEGIEINARSSFSQWSPLRLAAEDEDEEAVSWLINNGADVNQQDSFEQTPLYSGAINGNMKIISSLVQNGADVNKEDMQKSNPLYEATEHRNIEAVKYLMSNKAIVKASKKHRKTPLHAAVVNRDLPMMKTLIQFDKNIDNDIDMVDENGKSALYYVIEDSSMPLLVHLLENNADVNIEDVIGRTPLQVAAKNGSVVMAKSLIYDGADINYRDASGWTAFDYSVAQNNEVAKSLMEHGSNIETRDIQKALLFIYSNNYLEVTGGIIESRMIEYLIGLTRVHVLHCAAIYGNVKGIHYLIKGGVDVNASNDLGLTALHYAAMYGRIKAIEALHSCNAGMNPLDSSRLTPLHYAARHDHKEAVRTLLSYRASIWIYDICGERAIDLAENDDIRQLLKEEEERQTAHSLIYTKLETSSGVTVGATSLANNIERVQLNNNEVNLLANNLSYVQLESDTEAYPDEMYGGVKEQGTHSPYSLTYRKRKLSNEMDSDSSTEADECNNKWSHREISRATAAQKYSSFHRY